MTDAGELPTEKGHAEKGAEIQAEIKPGRFVRVTGFGRRDLVATMPLTEEIRFAGGPVVLVLRMSAAGVCCGIDGVEADAPEWVSELVTVVDFALRYAPAFQLFEDWSARPFMHSTVPLLRQIVELEAKRRDVVREAFRINALRVAGLS